MWVYGLSVGLEVGFMAQTRLRALNSDGNFYMGFMGRSRLGF